jgi:hypothetical protein
MLQYDPVKLLAALPVRQLRPSKKAVELPPNLHPLSRSYNGFSGAERRRGWQLNLYLKQMGSLPWPKLCDICSAPGAKYHSENYFASPNSPAVCRSCHYILHTRWRNPESFMLLVGAHGNGTKWFEFLGTRAIDLAGYLRDVHGGNAFDDPLCNPLFQLPGNITPPPLDAFVQLSESVRHRSRVQPVSRIKRVADPAKSGRQRCLDLE